MSKRKREKKPAAPARAKRITPRQARFIAEFCRTRNGAHSAREAGYNPSRAKQVASELRTDPKYAHVEAEIQRRLADREAQDQLQHEVMVNALMCRITFNPARLKDESGKFKALKDLDPEDAQHIASIQEVEYKHGAQPRRRKRGEEDEEDDDLDDLADESSQNGTTVAFKLTNQLEAIKILGKHNGFFSPRESAGETAPYRAAEAELAGMLDRLERRTAEPIPGSADDGAAADS